MSPRRLPTASLPTFVLVAVAAAGCGSEARSAGPPREDPRRADVVRFWERFGRATSLRMRGDLAGAARAYEEALALDARHEDALYYLGQCRRELGEHAQAREAFARLVETNASSARGHLALGALLASPDPAEPLELETAERHLRRAHEINAEETGPMLRLGEILIVRGRAAEARHWLEAAARTNPKSVEAAFLAGYLRWEDGDRLGAEELFGKAVGASRADAPPRGVLGEGDRRAAAPPLPSPMGRTLFGGLTDRLRRSNASPPDMAALYGAVREARRGLARRAAP